MSFKKRISMREIGLVWLRIGIFGEHIRSIKNVIIINIKGKPGKVK